MFGIIPKGILKNCILKLGEIIKKLVKLNLSIIHNYHYSKTVLMPTYFIFLLKYS